MMNKDQAPLPLPPDAQQVTLMHQVIDGGVSIASEGTERFELLSHLADGGFVSKVHCPMAMGVFQFSVTLAGLEVLQ